MKSSREPLARDEGQEHGHEPVTGDEHERREQRRLAERQSEVADGSEAGRPPAARRRCPPRSGASVGSRTRTTTVKQVLDDEPADRDPALRRVELVAVHERPQQDDGAGDRDGEAEDEPAADPPAQRHAERTAPRTVAMKIWPMAPGIGDRPDRERGRGSRTRCRRRTSAG